MINPLTPNCFSPSYDASCGGVETLLPISVERLVSPILLCEWALSYQQTRRSGVRPPVMNKALCLAQLPRLRARRCND
jgi:hypothetical protein